MLDYTLITIPLRIIGIQQRTTLDKAHETLSEMWQQWEGNHKANRLPSFTMTIYCVYQYFDDAPNDVLITIGRITATDFPLPSFAGEIHIPPQDYARFIVPEPSAQSVYQTWGEIEDNSSLKRTFTTDFETYMLDGLPRIYVGCEPPKAA